MKRTERHHLKENELVHTVERVKQAYDTNRKPIIAGVVLVAVIIVGAIGFMAWRSSKDDQARTLLVEALYAEQAQVAPAAVPGATPPPAPAGSYPSARARDEAALAKFMAVATAYPSVESGIAARYHAATLLLALGRAGEALQRYQEVVDRAGDSLYGQMAGLGLADAQVAAGQADKAIQTYKAMAERKDGSLPVDGLLMQLGRAYEAAGKAGEARQTFKRIVDEFPQSPYSAEAKRLTELPGR